MLDAATGLIYVGNGQYYDPATGRFLTRGVYPGSPNPYVPWQGDPLGMMLGPLALVALIRGKRKGGKVDQILVVLIVVLAVGGTVVGCGDPTPTTQPPTATLPPPEAEPTQSPDPTQTAPAPTKDPGSKSSTSGVIVTATPTETIIVSSGCDTTIDFETELEECTDESCRTEKAKRVFELLSTHIDKWWGNPPNHMLIAAFILKREGGSLDWEPKFYMAKCIYDLYSELVCNRGSDCNNMEGLYKWMGAYTVTFSPARPLVSDFDEEDWKLWQTPPPLEEQQIMEDLFQGKKSATIDFVNYTTGGSGLARRWWTLSEVNNSLREVYDGPCYYRHVYPSKNPLYNLYFGDRYQFSLKDQVKGSLEYQKLRSYITSCN